MSDDAFHKARAYYAYFQQGEVWVPNGKPPVQITDMDPAWRHNAARFLVRNAKAYLHRYEFGEHLAIWHGEARDVTGEMVSSAPSGAAADGVERELEDSSAARAKDPEGWIRSTPLYKALVCGLHGVEAEAWTPDAGVEMWAVQLPTQAGPVFYGPFEEHDVATRFARFVSEEIDPAKVVPLRAASTSPTGKWQSPLIELLNFRERMAEVAL
jgi:hypothetical protein